MLVIAKARPDLAGGNSKYAAGAMRFAYAGCDDLLPLLEDPGDPRLPDTEFGAYPAERFASDLLGFNDGRRAGAGAAECAARLRVRPAATMAS